MKKYVTLLALLPLLTSCCSKNWKWQDHRTDKDSYYFMSEKLKNFDTSFDYNSLSSSRDVLLNTIKNKGNKKQITSAYSNYKKLCNRLTEIFDVVTVYYYGAATDYVEKYNKIYDILVECEVFEASLFQEAANSSDDVKMFFFGTLDQTKIDEQLGKSEVSKITAQLNAQLDQISEDFNFYFSTLETYKTEEALQKGIETYVEYVNIANQLAEVNNCDNYLEYSYKNIYNRDYTPLDGYNFAQNVKSSFSEIGFKNKNYLPTNDGSADYNNLYKLIYKNFNNINCDGAKLFDDYADYMGQNYIDTYNSLWRDGHYFFSNRDDSLGTAFILFDNVMDYQIAFFSKGMQDVSSVVHEFGHYYAIHNYPKNESQSYDILETHSQANEYVFANYVKNNYKNKFSKYFGDHKFYNDASYLIDFSYIIDVENYAYNETDLTTEKLSKFISDLSAKYKNLNIQETYNYWLYPCICSACYYISYATSSLEAMQFYLLDLDNAKSKYKDFCSNAEGDSTLQKWLAAGLKSPFTKDTLSMVANYLKTLN
ncbi:MAG: hypothetical protein KBS97_03815 [Firmicutes bacterium]|nr:hypothetical protein [Candidatus Fiminaster equi]